MTKIILVDDHFLVRDGIRALLEEEHEYEVIGEASNGKEGVALVQSLQPDIVISDIRMPEMSGIQMVEALSSLQLSVKTIMLSMHDSDEYILQSITVGADGYLLKGASKEEFLKALSTVSKGEKYFSGDVSTTLINKLLTANSTNPSVSTELVESLIDTTDDKDVEFGQEMSFELTKREKQILQLAVSGKTNKEIASELNISKRTIEVHRFNLMKKMGVKNVLELSNKARRYGLI